MLLTAASSVSSALISLLFKIISSLISGKN